MPKLAQVSMAAGEVSSSLYGRTDLARYAIALRRCRDFIIRPTGGVVNRPGTIFIAKGQNSTQATRVIPFIVSEDVSYALEFSNLKVAIFNNGAPVADISSPSTITNVVDQIISGSPRRTITTSAAHPFVVGQSIIISGTTATGTFDPDGTWEVLEVPGATSLRIAGSGSPSGTYVSGGSIYPFLTLTSVYTAAELFDIRWTQSADVLTLVHPDHPVYELRRLSANSFQLVQATYENGPFEDINSSVTTYVHASADWGTVTLTASSSIFQSGHVGSLFYIEQQDGHEIPPWEPGKRLVAVGSNVNGLLRSSDGKNYRCATNYQAATNEVVTGTVRPTHDYGIEADGNGLAVTSGAERAGVDWEYRDSGFGIVKITAYSSGTSVTGTVIKRIPYSCVGGVTAIGTWSMTGDGVDTTLSIAGAVSGNKYDYEVTYDGVIQDPAGYTVNPVTDVLTFAVAPANLVSVQARELSPNHRTNVWAFGAWSSINGYPSEVEYYGDRQIFAATADAPQTMWMSRVGDYKTLVPSVPLVDDDSISVTLNARALNKITDLVPLDSLVALTGRGPWRMTSGRDEVITPTSIGSKPQSQNGSGSLPAILVGDTAVYFHVNHRTLFDLKYTIERDGYSGNDLSITSEHLFKTTPAVDLAYQENPLWTIWFPRSDGLVASLTYIREHDVIGWALHNFNGLVESVCSIPESGEYGLYLVVNRNGVRMIERLASRFPTDSLDYCFMDSALRYDGRNTSTTTMALTSVTGGWTITDQLTLTSSVAAFDSSGVGDVIVLKSATNSVRLRIIEYTSTTVVTVNAEKDVPEEFWFGELVTTWEFARDRFSGLNHLIGETVTVYADGAVLSQEVVDSTGSVDIDEPSVRVTIGLPYSPTLETLDLFIVGSESIMGSAKNVPQVTVQVAETRSISAGPDDDHLDEAEPRLFESYSAVPDPLTGVAMIPVDCDWSKTGRVVIQQPDPLPMTVLAIIPQVRVGGSS